MVLRQGAAGRLAVVVVVDNGEAAAVALVVLAAAVASLVALREGMAAAMVVSAAVSPVARATWCESDWRGAVSVVELHVLRTGHHVILSFPALIRLPVIPTW